MELLPEEAECDHLLDQLARLLLMAGQQTFLAGPLIEPNEQWFPDHWTPDVNGIERLLRRLLGYSGLAHLDLVIDIDRFSDAAGEVGLDGRPLGHQGTAAWFAGIRNGRCSFGVDTAQLGDPAGLVGTLAHEVAHAYRHAHELCVADSAIEERLTDLTTVYLGFGVLTANASQRFRSGRDGAGRTWWSRAEGGYLGMQAMSYALAAQVVARGEAQPPVARLLSPNQRACFKAAAKQLGPRAALLERLGVSAAAAAIRPSESRSGGWLKRLFRS